MMDRFEIFLEIISAIGSIATAISVLLLLLKFRKRLKVTGTFPIKNGGIYLISIYNNTMYDNEIKSICFSKGNIKSLWKDSTIFYSVDFNDFNLELNKYSKNIIVHKGDNIEIPISCKCIVCNYETIGEMFGKPYEKVFVRIVDKNGHNYYLKTDVNIEYFRKISKYLKTR